jgi:hypothetical protein
MRGSTLSISPTLFRKLGVSNRAELAAAVHEH